MMPSLDTAITVVSAFGVTIIYHFTIGLATESFIGSHDAGSCAIGSHDAGSCDIFDVACTKDSPDHPGLTQVGEEISILPFSNRAKTLGVNVPNDRPRRLGKLGDRCLRSSLPCNRGITFQ